MTRQQRLVLVIAILASFVGGLDGFIVNVALPAISRELGGGLVVQQWVVDGYLLTLGSLILIAGSLSDLFGRKMILTVGLWWFGVASALCALAPNGATLIVARALQGVGGALLVPSSLALIMSAFSGAAQGKAIGRWTAWISIAPLVGPLLGGFLVGAASWRWIFLVNLPPIALTLWVLRGLEVPERTTKRARVDWWGAILCAAGLAALVYGLIEQPSYGWADVRVWPGVVLGGLLLIGFVRYEYRRSQPMLPLDLFRQRNFAVGNLATLLVYAGLAASSFIVTVTLQQVGGYSALGAGLALLPVTILMIVLASRAGALAGRFGPRWFMALGPMVASVGFLLMLRMQPQVHYVRDLLPGVLLFGLGLSTTVAPLTSAILGAIDPARSGIASAVNNAVARVAGLIAVALIGLATGPHLDITGFHRALVAVAVLLFAGGVVSALGIRNDVHQAGRGATSRG